MSIFISNFKRLKRKGKSFIYMLLFPIIWLTVISLIFSGSFQGINIAVVDYDNTQLSKALIASLEEENNVMLVNEREIQSHLVRREADYGIVIPKGYKNSILAEEDMSLTAYKGIEPYVAMTAEMTIQNFISGAKNIAKSAEDWQQFNKGMEELGSGNYSYTITRPEQSEEIPLWGIFSAIGFLVMGMLFLATSTTSLIMEDRKILTFNRIAISPLSIKSYMLQNLLSFWVISLFQVLLTFVILSQIFNINLGQSPFMLYAFFALFSVVSLAFGIAITSVSKNVAQTDVLANFLIVPMAMLGGALWPYEMMPQVLQQIGLFLPTYWAIDGANQIVIGATFMEILPNIIVLTLFAIVFFLIGAKKKGLSNIEE
ncbi:ABC transporter permease [Proteinivorax tanatarense]|uniref:ABC transporter permease n=1 Tax=Proteinivorax tanatarense TaxID=1260629 RepID=A0AAU7VPS8_9FIRM